MSEATAVEMLEAEHRVIQKMAAGMSVLADQLEGGEPVDVALLESIVAFLRTFADRLHHTKEESFLFPALIRRGVPSQGCPIGGLTMEHQKRAGDGGRVGRRHPRLRRGRTARAREPREKPARAGGLLC